MNKRHIEISLAHDIGRGLFDLMQCLVDEQALPAAAQTLYKASWEVNIQHRVVEWDDPEASLQRVAMLLSIDALLAAPEATLEAIKRLRDDLVAGDPNLALLK